jgi:hypothetical protein
MNRIQRYHRNMDLLHWAIVGAGILAAGAFDVALVWAWWTA